ncbi:MAG TPA: helix-hairpin-helix domain-containing protein [Planctomycetota bacterium]|nr:helix-hairpin-helix domain-containing protein [Planctomycetota bacterium]
MRSAGVAPGERTPLSNERLGQRLEEVANLLEAQAANAFRVRAYRRAAGTVRSLDRPVHAILAERGLEGLLVLPGIGRSLARAIEQLVQTDHLSLLDRLRGGAGSIDVFTTVPSIGEELARRIHEELGIESLYELEIAAHDGRLRRVPGMGSGRIQAVCESLAGRFRRGRSTPDGVRQRAAEGPPVAELLDVDREYREKALAHALPLIAPRRFNPTGAAWLPILHTERGQRHYTALYSNTARAHELGTTHDWVVIYRDDGAGDGQCTVVTQRVGVLSGRRVVRGREVECRDHYSHETTAGCAT